MNEVVLLLFFLLSLFKLSNSLLLPNDLFSLFLYSPHDIYFFLQSWQTMRCKLRNDSVFLSCSYLELDPSHHFPSCSSPSRFFYSHFDLSLWKIVNWGTIWLIMNIAVMITTISSIIIREAHSCRCSVRGHPWSKMWVFHGGGTGRRRSPATPCPLESAVWVKWRGTTE